MSSIMNDIEKIQVDTSHILADLLRQVFIVVGLLFSAAAQRLEAGPGQPHRSTVSCWRRRLAWEDASGAPTRRAQDDIPPS